MLASSKITDATTQPRVIASVGHKFGGGGQGTTAAGTFGEALRKGVIKALFTWSYADEYANNSVIKTCPFTAIPKTTYRLFKYTPILKNKPISLRWLIDDLVFDFWVSRQIARFPEPIDVFHGWHHQALFSMRAAKRRNAKIVVEHLNAHPTYFKSQLSRESQSYNSLSVYRAQKEFMEADCIIVPSDFVKSTFRSTGIELEKIKVIPYGVDPTIFHPASLKQTGTSFSVLFVGTIDKRKGCDVLIDAFTQANISDSRLDFVGSVQPDMKSTVDELKHPNIYFHGHCAPLPFYQQASVFVLPSRIEGSALVSYEAAACGLPIITTFESGTIIQDAIDGIIIAKNDPDNLANQLVRLATDDELRRRLSLNARQNVLSYTWQNRGKNIVQLYNEIMSR